MTSDKGDLVRAAMRNWASGVTVVTTQLDEQTPVGLTASSFTSVSLEPPLLMVCIFKETDLAQTVLQTKTFGISLLSDAQASLSGRFAGFDPDFPKDANRFIDLNIRRLETNSPLLADALVGFDCRLWANYDGSTHYIFVGEVVDLFVTNDEMQKPLVYFNRNYHDLTPQS